MIGHNIAHYTITEKIGEGGMGEVYRATDTKLKRDVALKVLPESFTQDPQRLARFTREAQVLASLNHPNIGAIHGLEEEDGVRALVLELIEGEDLSERIAKGPIPLRESLQIALQITEALEAAHEKGIIHRDLKPANVKITPEGQVKVLDFGLAKAMEEAPENSPEMTHSPTLTMQATQAGIILGTAAYMSPEQAKGLIVDQRSDIWSFGAVLFEMLAGQKPFVGDDITEILASVVKVDLDWDTLPSELPASAQRWLRRCLRADPKKRYQGITDIRLDIEDCLDSPEAETATTLLPSTPTAFWKVPAVWVSLALAIILTAFATWFLKPVPEPEPPRRVVRFAVSAPEDGRLSNVQFAISPDGNNLVYVVISPTGRALSIRPFDTMDSSDLSGTEGAFFPFWSQDSRFVGFFANGLIKKIDTLGGPAQTITESASGVGTWNRAGDILFAKNGVIHRVSAAGGTSTPLTSIDGLQGIGNHETPHFLPDGNRFLYFARADNGGVGSVFVGALDGKPSERLLNADSEAVYAAGYVIFMRENTLLAQGFDPGSLRTTGEPFAALSDPVRLNGRYGGFSLSDGGSLAYNPGVLGGESNAYWMDHTGNETFVFGPHEYAGGWGREFQAPAVSPDGTQVAVSVLGRDGSSSIWLFDSDTGTPRTLPTEGDSHSPVWSPDASKIAFASGNDIYLMPADGSGPAKPLWTSDYQKLPSSWSSNDELAFVELNPKNELDIWVYKNGNADPLVETPVDDHLPSFSPDGRWIAYQSGVAVYVQPYPGPSGPVQIALGEFSRNRLLWASNGQELFYRNVFGLAVADLNMDARLSVESTGQVFRDTAFFAGIHPMDDRFLIFRQVDDSDGQINIVLNWLEELDERVSVP